MREIAIVASGSRGDVQPYVALGVGLRAAGYAVRVLASDSFETLVTDAGLTFCSTGASIESLLQTDAWMKTLDSGNFLKILARMQQETKRAAAENAERLPPLLKGSDLIVSGLAGIGGAFAAAGKFGIPVIHAHVFPFTPTTAFPSPLVPKLPLGGVLNRVSFHVTRQMFWRMSKAGDAAMRQALGLKQASFWGPYRAMAQSAEPVLYGYSRHVLPRPDDWTENCHVTGYWFLEPPADWKPGAELAAFLEAGAPPVYIGFGSMGSRDPEKAANIALEALRLSGQRGILATGWGGMKAAELPAHVHVVSSVPHSWLFERMTAVVHHGGAGTTAAALRAGVPSVITPFMGDQPFWGKRVADLGVGTLPIPRKKLSAEGLADAITEAVSDSAMRQRAKALAEKIRGEDGVGNAVALIDQFMNARTTARK